MLEKKRDITDKVGERMLSEPDRQTDTQEDRETYGQIERQMKMGDKRERKEENRNRAHQFCTIITLMKTIPHIDCVV